MSLGCLTVVHPLYSDTTIIYVLEILHVKQLCVVEETVITDIEISYTLQQHSLVTSEKTEILPACATAVFIEQYQICTFVSVMLTSVTSDACCMC